MVEWHQKFKDKKWNFFVPNYIFRQTAKILPITVSIVRRDAVLREALDITMAGVQELHRFHAQHNHTRVGFVKVPMGFYIAFS